MAVPVETIVTWLPVDLRTDLPLEGDALESVGFGIDLLSRQEAPPGFERVVTRSFDVPVATFSDLPPLGSGLEPAVEVHALSQDGDILAQTGIVQLVLEPAEPIELSPTQCQEACDRWRAGGGRE